MMRTKPTVLALLVLTASAGMANAQTDATLRAALQRAVVVEEQEHDLATAAKLYREVARDAAAAEHAQVRGEALLRLGELLLRLGKDEEARAALEQAAELGGEIGERAQAALQGQGQEGEREQKLRERAREILNRIMEDYGALYRDGTNSEALPGMPDEQAVRDILWIGQPAVPEILRLLEQFESTIASEIRAGHGDADMFADVSRFRGLWQATGLMALLWKLGGEQAARYLEGVQEHDLLGMRRAAAWASHVADDPRMIEVAQGFLQDPDPGGEVPIAVLSESLSLPTGGGRGHQREPHTAYASFPAPAIVDLVDSEVPAVRVHVLNLIRDNWNQLSHDPDPQRTSALLVPKLRNALEALDPQVGQAAQRLLVSQATVTSAAGRSLVLDWIPRLDEDLDPGFHGAWPQSLLQGATAHLDEVLRTARALGPVKPRPYGPYERLPGRHNLLKQLVLQIYQSWGSDAVSGVLELVQLGYESREAWLSRWLGDNAQDSDLLALARSLPLLPEPGPILRRLADPDLPAEAWPHLRDYAESRERLGQDDLEAIGWTGTDEAAQYLLEHLRAHPDAYVPIVWGLLDLSHENQGEVARAALREALGMPATGATVPRIRNAVFARLAQLDDDPAIELFPGAYQLGLVAYPPHNAPPDYRSGNRRGLEWLAPLEDGSDFHRYDEEQLARAWRLILEQRVREDEIWYDARRALCGDSGSRASVQVGDTALVYDVVPYSGQAEELRLVPPLVLDTVGTALSARANLGFASPSNVAHSIHTIAAALAAATTDGTDFPARRLRTWAARTLSHTLPTLRFVVLKHLPGPAVRMLGEEVEKRLVDEYPEITWAAVQALIRADLPIGEDVFERLLANPAPESRARAMREVAPRVGEAALPLVLPLLEDPDASVRAAVCAFLGSTVQTDAVPPLLQALRDPEEEVRKAAAEALEQIRFYHDQKGHWARVFDGVDASSNAAAEKLLLQAKPDRPRDTRLMAIRSLGALGVPEALPFLIDYSASEDEELAQAARDAITAIHAKAGVK